jgi:hypothetical protein
MVSYIDAFHLLFIASLMMLPLILLMRPTRSSGDAPAMHMD